VKCVLECSRRFWTKNLCFWKHITNKGAAETKLDELQRKIRFENGGQHSTGQTGSGIVKVGFIWKCGGREERLTKAKRAARKRGGKEYIPQKKDRTGSSAKK